MPVAELGVQYGALVEKLIGRPLRRAERAIDVLGLDSALERAKNELDRTIREEMLRATLEWVAGVALSPALRVTPAMLEILEALRELGRQEAAAELERLGYRGVKSESDSNRAFVFDPIPTGGDVESYLRRELPAISTRIEDELVHVDLSDASQAVVRGALFRVPGARDIASRVISTALIGGMGETWEQNADLVRCWEYSAVLDGRVCSRCRPLDGKRYSSLEALFEDLPQFGPNPRCLGGGRCRCRAVPCDPDEVGQNEPDAPTPELEQDAPAHVLAARRARAALDPLRVIAEPVRAIATDAEKAERAALRLELEKVWKATNAIGDTVPAAGIQAVEREIIAAGEALDATVSERVAAVAGDLPARIEQAQLELAGTARQRAAIAEDAYHAERKARDAAEAQLLERLKDELRAQGFNEWEVLARARSNPEFKALVERNTLELQALRTERQIALDLVYAGRKAVAELESELVEIERKALLEALQQIRGVGNVPAKGRAWAYTSGGTRGQAKQLAEEAGRLFPDDWRARADRLPIEARFRSGARAWARSDGTILFSDGERSRVIGDLDGLATAIHELGHHVEHTNPLARLLEWSFYQRRTRPGSLDAPLEPLRRLYKGPSEKYREDGFLDNYMGKTYGDGAASNYELLSMGLESVWTRSHELDPEMRRWILGLLAAL